MLALLVSVFLFAQSTPASAAGTPCSITPVLTEANLNTCIAEAPTDNSEFAITLGADFNITAQKTITAGKNITLASDATIRTLTRDAGFTGILFSLPANSSLTLSNITLDGNKSTVTNSTGSLVSGAGSLTLNAATLQNNIATSGGAIYSAGTVTITGSTITGNAATTTGGGIRINATSAVLVISGSNITSNIAISSGGGIYSNGTIEITNSTFSYNESGAAGGGIISSNTTIITGSTITGNVASGSYSGGGLYATGAMEMADCTVSNNIAGTGGGIRMDNVSATFSILRTNVTGNTASYSNGGGILSNGIVEIIDSAITGNTAAWNGNGIQFAGGSMALGGNTQIGDALGSSNGISLSSNMIIGIKSDFAGFANIERASDPYLGRPVVQGAAGYTALASDIAKFAWLPADFALEFNASSSRIVLGEITEPPIVPAPPITPPSTGLFGSDPNPATSSALGVTVSAIAISLVVLFVIARRSTSRHSAAP